MTAKLHCFLLSPMLPFLTSNYNACGNDFCRNKSLYKNGGKFKVFQIGLLSDVRDFALHAFTEKKLGFFFQDPKGALTKHKNGALRM